MRKRIYTYCTLFIVCTVFLFTATACSQKEKEISTVASNYLKALADYRLNDAKKYGDESAARFLDEQQKVINSWSPEELEEARKALENTEVKISHIQIKNAKATVTYEFVKNGIVLQSELLYLIKNPTGWQVQEFM